MDVVILDDYTLAEAGGSLSRGDGSGGAGPVLHQRAFEHGVRAAVGERRSARCASGGAATSDATVVLGVTDRGCTNHAVASDGQLGLSVRAVHFATLWKGSARQKRFSAERELFISHGDRFARDELADTGCFAGTDSTRQSPALHRDAHAGHRRCGWHAARHTGRLCDLSRGRRGAEDAQCSECERGQDGFEGTVHGGTP